MSRYLFNGYMFSQIVRELTVLLTNEQVFTVAFLQLRFLLQWSFINERVDFLVQLKTKTLLDIYRCSQC